MSELSVAMLTLLKELPDGLGIADIQLIMGWDHNVKAFGLSSPTYSLTNALWVEASNHQEGHGVSPYCSKVLSITDGLSISAMMRKQCPMTSCRSSRGCSPRNSWSSHSARLSFPILRHMSENEPLYPSPMFSASSA